MSLGTQAKPSGKLLDYEQFIDHQIQRTRRRIKVTDIITASLTLLVAFLAVLFLEVVFDHFFGLPLLLRRVVLAAGMTSACLFAAMRVAMPIVRRINGIYAARTIENTDPTFKNSLINYLELRKQRGQVPKAIMATLESRAVSDLAHVEVDTVVNQQRLIRTAYALSGVIVVFCLYAAFAPKSILDSTRRAFLADLTRPTNTRLANIKPGSDPELSQVVAGSHVVFAADVQGTRPRKVLLHFSVDGGKFFAVREFAPGRNLYDPWQVTYTSAQQSMEYYLSGGDAESDRYHIEVLPAPTITSISHDLTFKSYTKLEPRNGIEGGTVQALEGTKVTVHAKTNMPAVTATINLSGAAPAQMDVDTQDSTMLTGSFEVPPADKRGSYTIQFRTTGGQLNPSPVTYDIDSIPDRPPTARFVQPDKPAIKVPANVKVDLVATGSDDHGVRTANLVVLSGDRVLITKDLLEGQEPKPEFKAVETIDPEKLGLKPGSSVHYRLSVFDNKEPSPNKMETTLQLIEIIEPVTPPEKQKLEDAQKNQQRNEPSPTREEEPNQEQPPPQEGPANANEQANPNTQEATGKEGGPPDKSNDAPAKAGPDTGRDTEQPGTEKEDGAADNQNQLSPEKEQKIRELLARDAKNQQKPSNKDANSTDSKPQSGNEPGQSDKQDSSATPNKNDQTQEGSEPKSKGAKQPGKSQQPDGAKPQGNPPQDGSNEGNDPSNQVKKADQSSNPGAPEPGTKNDQPKTGQEKNQRSGQPQTGEPGTEPKSEGADKQGEPKPGEQSPDKPGDAKQQDQNASPPSRKNADSSKAEKTGKDDAQTPGESPDAKGNPDAKDDASAKASPDTKSDPKSKDSSETKGNTDNTDNKDMRKDASAREASKDSSTGKNGESGQDKTDAAKNEKANGKDGQDDAAPKDGKRGSDKQSKDDQAKSGAAGDKEQADESANDKAKSGDDNSTKNSKNSTGKSSKTKDSQQKGEAGGEPGGRRPKGKDGSPNGAPTIRTNRPADPSRPTKRTGTTAQGQISDKRARKWPASEQGRRCWCRFQEPIGLGRSQGRSFQECGRRATKGRPQECRGERKESGREGQRRRARRRQAGQDRDYQRRPANAHGGAHQAGRAKLQASQGQAFRARR